MSVSAPRNSSPNPDSDHSTMPLSPISDVPWSTRVLVYRDAYMLASTDGSVSPAEETHLADLANRMALPLGFVESVWVWVRDYGNLLERLDDLLSGPGANVVPRRDGGTPEPLATFGARDDHSCPAELRSCATQKLPSPEFPERYQSALRRCHGWAVQVLARLTRGDRARHH